MACSVIPSSEDCVLGSQSISLMDSTFQSLDATTQAQYQQQHDALMAAFHSQYSFYSPWIPFNPYCCAVEEIGEQADALTLQMTNGAVKGPSVTPSGIQLPSGGQVTAGLVILGALALYLILEK
jgi:hypothetical protein